jgi:hypothetical protein
MSQGRSATARAPRLLFAVVQVIGLGLPAGRQGDGERGVNEPGHRGGVRAAGVPLQGERDQRSRLDGRITLVVCAAARDGMSRIQSISGWSVQRVAARSVSVRSTVGGLMPAASRACR